MRVAVIGSGIAGLGAAWALQRRHDTVVYEAESRLGGHANTLDVTVGGRTMPVDTGFIVYNELNYPNLVRLFATLGVATLPSDMSFAVSIDRGRVEYGGSLAGLAAQPRNLLRPRYLGMVRDLVRFYRNAPALLDGPPEPGLSLGGYLDREGYGAGFVNDHLLPMGAAIWSCPVATMRDFPAISFVRFFANHRLMDMGARPQWRTVAGGSREYVGRIAAVLGDRVRRGRPVAGVRRDGSDIVVTDAAGAADRFDRVVLATHGDTALALLGDGAAPDERAVLGAFRYEDNRAVLHTSQSLMPKRRRVWASWNYLAERAAGEGGDGRKVAVSYLMNRLQQLPTEVPVILTLNPPHEPPAGTVLFEKTYAHPVFDAAALAAQQALPTIQGRGGIWYCGAHCGHGFHEDGLQSGLAVAAALGAAAPWAASVVPASAAGYAVQRPLADAAD